MAGYQGTTALSDYAPYIRFRTPLSFFAGSNSQPPPAYRTLPPAYFPTEHFFDYCLDLLSDANEGQNKYPQFGAIIESLKTFSAAALHRYPQIQYACPGEKTRVAIVLTILANVRECRKACLIPDWHPLNSFTREDLINMSLNLSPTVYPISIAARHARQIESVSSDKSLKDELLALREHELFANCDKSLDAALEEQLMVWEGDYQANPWSILDHFFLFPCCLVASMCFIIVVSVAIVIIMATMGVHFGLISDISLVLVASDDGGVIMLGGLVMAAGLCLVAEIGHQMIYGAKELFAYLFQTYHLVEVPSKPLSPYLQEQFSRIERDAQERPVPPAVSRHTNEPESALDPPPTYVS